MHKWILTSLTVAFAFAGLAVAVPVATGSQSQQAIVREKLGEIGAWAVPSNSTQSSRPIVSEKVAGLNLATFTEVGAIDPWQQNLNARAKYAQTNDPWALNLFARQSHRDSEQTSAGSPTTVSVVSTGGFNWDDAGIGAAFAVGIVLVGSASLVTIRRHHGPLAH